MAVDEANTELSTDDDTGGGLSRNSFHGVPINLAEAARSSASANLEEDVLDLVTDLGDLSRALDTTAPQRRNQSSTRRSGENDGLHNETAASSSEVITMEKVEAMITNAVNNAIETFARDVSSVTARVKLLEDRLASEALERT